MADRLAQGLATCPGVRLPWPCEANEVFAILPRAADSALKAAGAIYYHWGTRGLAAGEVPGSDEVFVRLIPSVSTQAQAVGVKRARQRIERWRRRRDETLTQTDGTNG